MKWFSVRRFRLSSAEREESAAAAARASSAQQLARSLRASAAEGGARQRQIRRDNGFGASLDHVYRKA